MKYKISVKQPWRFPNSDETCTVKISSATSRFKCTSCDVSDDLVRLGSSKRTYNGIILRGWRLVWAGWRGPYARPQFSKMICASVLTIPYPRNFSLPFSDPIRNYYQLLLLGIIYRERIESVCFYVHRSSSTLSDCVGETVQLSLVLGLPTTPFPPFFKMDTSCCVNCTISLLNSVTTQQIMEYVLSRYFAIPYNPHNLFPLFAPKFVSEDDQKLTASVV
jgi:hypothetical protein